MGPRAALNGVDDPDVGHAELKIIFNPLLHRTDGIILREDLDANERGLAIDRRIRPWSFDDANVRNAKPLVADLHALLDDRV
jgi:hypothetical protein